MTSSLDSWTDSLSASTPVVPIPAGESAFQQVSVIPATPRTGAAPASHKFLGVTLPRLPRATAALAAAVMIGVSGLTAACGSNADQNRCDRESANCHSSGGVYYPIIFGPHVYGGYSPIAYGVRPPAVTVGGRAGVTVGGGGSGGHGSTVSG